MTQVIIHVLAYLRKYLYKLKWRPCDWAETECCVVCQALQSVNIQQIYVKRKLNPEDYVTNSVLEWGSLFAQDLEIELLRKKTIEINIYFSPLIF